MAEFSMPNTLVTIFSRQYFSYFSQETGFDISCKLSPLFSGKNKKNIRLSSYELAERVLRIKLPALVAQLDVSNW